MYRRIMNWPRLGRAVHDFVAFGVVSMRGKVVALAGMAACATLTFFIFGAAWMTLAAVAGIAIGAGFVVTRPSEAALRPYGLNAAPGHCPFLAQMQSCFPPAPRFSLPQ